MIITSLKKKRSDVEICFDDNSKLLLDYRVVFDNGLRRNDLLNESQINIFLYRSEKHKIKDSAFRFLSRRLHSSQELRTKLIKKRFRKEIIDEVIMGLVNKNFLNDLNFAQSYLNEKISRKREGFNKVKADLIKKGIARNIIAQLIDLVDSNLLEKNAFELARKKLSFLKARETDNKKMRQKLFSFLMSKGYEIDLINIVLNKLNLEKGEEHYDLL